MCTAALALLACDRKWSACGLQQAIQNCLEIGWLTLGGKACFSEFLSTELNDMISKKLAIAAAIALLTGLGAGQALAQSSDQPPAPAMASPSGAPAAGDQ